jgi:hypothetical protein
MLQLIVELCDKELNEFFHAFPGGIVGEVSHEYQASFFPTKDRNSYRIEFYTKISNVDKPYAIFLKSRDILEIVLRFLRSP